MEYNGILLSHKKDDVEPFWEMWLDLESFIQSEVGKKEKNKYCIILFVCEI